MARDSHRIHIRKEAIKFSAAHMTVFPDGTKEPLHGHDYQVSLTLELADASLKNMVSFAAFKKSLAALCAKWDERVLLAAKCPFFKVRGRARGEIEFTLCRKRYVVPADEAVMVSVENITTELLSKELCLKFVKTLDRKLLTKNLRSVALRVDESDGQGSSYEWRNPAASGIVAPRSARR